MKIIKEVHKILIEVCLQQPGARILAGVSGGPDSMCVLDLLCSLEYDVIVAHVDHNLRPESAAEAAMVEYEARKRGLSFVTCKVDVKTLAKDDRLSLEEAARAARYRFLFEQAHLHRASAVVVAHNADDQVETVLMHLLRGSGLAGLKGMIYRSLASEWSADIPLVRPLLGTWRSEVEAYCLEHDLKPVMDATNKDTTFFRNRLRHEMIPYLASYNPQIKRILWRTAQNLAGDYEDQQHRVMQAWEEIGVSLAGGAVTFPPGIKKLPLAVQRQLLRRAAACLKPALRDVDFAAIERGTAYFKAPRVDQQVDLVDGLMLTADYHKIYLYDQRSCLDLGSYPAMPPQGELVLDLPGRVALTQGWHIELQEAGEQIDISTGTEEGPNQAFVDADALEFPLKIRARRSGDRYDPLGMEGKTVKLSDYWINNRLPRRARDLYPLVCSGERIVWIPGYRLAHFCRVKGTTHRVVRLRLLQPNFR